MAQVQSAVDCTASLWQVLGQAGPAPTAAPGTMPPGFGPVAAVMCSMTSVTDSAGQWSAIKETRYTGDLGALIAALHESDDVPPVGAACPAMAELPPALWLVDASGAAIWVRYPKDGCGFSKKDPGIALAALSATDLSVVKVQLVTPKAAIDSTCATGWKLMPPSAYPPAPGDSVSAASTAEVCRYRVSGWSQDDGAGVFESGRVLSDDDVSTAWSLATRGASAPPCTTRATEFGILQSADPNGGGPFYWVELDGCRRVYPQGGPAYRAPAALVALFG